MNSFLMIMSLLFFLTAGNAWGQIRPAPTKPIVPTGTAIPVGPTGPTGPTVPAVQTGLTGRVAATMVSVPEVRGYSREKAVTILQKAGLTPGKIDEKHSDQPKGTVISQEPEPRKLVEPHSSVNLTVAP